MELVGEYVGPDGERQLLRVVCEASGDADPLQKLLSGVGQMKELVPKFFESLIQREARNPVTADPDETLEEENPERILQIIHELDVEREKGLLRGNDEDDAEDENNIDKRINSDGPSAKRPKPPSEQ